MKKELYETIINNLNTRLLLCHTQLDQIHNTQDLELLPIASARDLRDFAINELDKQTKIIMVEFYHIIGMGNLSAQQTQVFIRKIKEYLVYRPLLKILAASFTDLDDLPKLPIHSKYKLSLLGNFELSSGEDAVELDSEEIDPEFVEQAKKLSCPFDLDGKRIQVHNLKDYLDILPALGLTDGKLENLQKKVLNGGEYFGVKWESRRNTSMEEPYLGKIVSTKIFQKLREFYNLHK